MINKLLIIYYTGVFVIRNWKGKYLGETPICDCGRENDHDSECQLELYALGLAGYLITKLARFKN